MSIQSADGLNSVMEQQQEVKLCQDNGDGLVDSEVNVRGVLPNLFECEGENIEKVCEK